MKEISPFQVLRPQVRSPVQGAKPCSLPGRLQTMHPWHGGVGGRGLGSCRQLQRAAPSLSISSPLISGSAASHTAPFLGLGAGGCTIFFSLPVMACTHLGHFQAGVEKMSKSGAPYARCLFVTFAPSLLFLLLPTPISRIKKMKNCYISKPL